MNVADYLIDPFAVGVGVADSWQPLGIVDLGACPADTAELDVCRHNTRPLGPAGWRDAFALPPFPLIGMGDPSHPLAPALDAIVESPVSVEALIRQITRAPRAAAATVQLLRSLDGLPIHRALQLESMCYGMLQASSEHAEWLAARAPARQPAAEGHVRVERHGAILEILIDRPQAHNAIDRRLRDQLFDAFTVAALDPELKSVRLRSVGPTFSVGGDLDEFGTTRDPSMAHLIRSRTLPALALAQRADIFDVHIQGACVGAGLEIAAFAARVTASPNAWLQLPELSMGLVPGAGGCVSVPRRIGRQRAALLMLSGRRINADTALRWGLIDAIGDS
jgi:enoyl-CoA hydratase/carnithine racemase